MSSSAASIASFALNKAVKAQQQYQILAKYFIEENKTSIQNTFSIDDVNSLIREKGLDVDLLRNWEKLSYINVSNKDRYWINEAAYIAYKLKYEKSMNRIAILTIGSIVLVIILMIGYTIGLVF